MKTFFVQETTESFLTFVDARIKLPALIILISMVISSENLGQIVVLLTGLFLTYAISGVDPRIYFRKIYLLLLFSLIVILPSILWTSGFYVATFMLKVYISLSLLVLFSLTTPLRDLLSALKFYRIPDILILTIASTYTQMHMLFRELSRILLARESRYIPSKRAGSYRDFWGRKSFEILGPFFLRVYEKGEIRSLAMMSRGFSGKFVLAKMTLKRSNTGLFMFCFLFLVVLWILMKSSFLPRI